MQHLLNYCNRLEREVLVSSITGICPAQIKLNQFGFD